MSDRLGLTVTARDRPTGMATRRTGGHGGEAAERGSGLLGMCFGVLFFLGFLLFATQLTVSLYARSVVTSAALDASRIMARSAGTDGVAADGEVAAAQLAAAHRVRELLGPEATFQLLAVDRAAGTVQVRVAAPRPHLLAGGGTLGSPIIERTVTVRLEQWQ